LLLQLQIKIAKTNYTSIFLERLTVLSKKTIFSQPLCLEYDFQEQELPDSFSSFDFMFKVEGVCNLLESSHPTILQQAVVTAGETFPRLGVFPGFWLISLHNLLHATSGGV
jgi:hypothetical protein